MAEQEILPSLSVSVAEGTEMSRDGFEFQLTPREVARLQRPLTETSGGLQSVMREVATRIYPGGVLKVSNDLMQRLFRMCCMQGPHGGYQTRLPLRVLGPIFAEHKNVWRGTWFYAKEEFGDLSRVKFGHTNRPSHRNRPYSTDNPRRLKVLFEIWDPSGQYELLVKQRFASAKASREWFLRTVDVNRFLECCCRVATVRGTTRDLPPLQ